MFAVLTATLLFSSCGEGTKGSENVSSESDANAIIGYTNAVIDYLNSSGKWTRSNEDKVATIVEAGKTGKKPRMNQFFTPEMNFNSDKTDVTAPTNALSKDEQAFFKDKMTTFKTAYEALKKECKELNDYLKNEDYKDDNNEKGKALATSIEANYKVVIDLRSELYAKIDVVTEKAEEIVLATHPLKDPILSLKKDLKGFEDLNDKFVAYSEKEATPAEVDAVYQAVVKSVEASKEANKEVLEKERKQSSYDSFYRSAESSLAAYRKALRDVKENKQLRDGDFRTFSSNHNSLVNSYNSFMK